MVLGLGKGDAGRDDIPSLLARKQYARAVELLKAQLHSGRPDDRSRLQLADVLVLAGKTREAVSILIPLADEYAEEGFAAKAISVLKKIEKIDPGRRDVGAKLAALIEAKQRQATVPAAVAPSLEIGMEEIDFNSGAVMSVSVPAEAESPAIPPDEPAPAPEDPPAPPVEEAPPAFLMEEAPFTMEAAPIPVDPEPLPDVSEPAPAASEPLQPVVDRDLVSEEGDAWAGVDELPEITLEAEPEPEPEPEMSEAAFGEELLSLVDLAFGAPDGHPAQEPAAPLQGGGQQIVVSPLFKDFSVDELVAVIQGLTLLTFEPGDIVISEGEPGDSLYMLTTGSVRVLKKNAAGKPSAVGKLEEGAFFGEGSILTGKPRTATVVATSSCEMLELDRETLDSIVKTHPRVREILEEFARDRGRLRPTS
jgi:hypothetical protein